MTPPAGPPPHTRRSPGRAAVAVAVALAVLAAAGLAGHLLRTRGRPASSTAPTAWPSVEAPAANGTGASGSATPSDDPATAAVDCPAGRTGPLREDTRFTTADGAGTVVPYSIDLPDDYYTACRQYPVVYALHGKGQDNAGFMADALSLRAPMTAGVLDQAIIVTPDSYRTGRWENRDTGPAEDNFLEYLIPYIEQHYRVRPGPAYRLLTGFSMGGHGAFRFGLKYPDMFAAVWSVDGAMAPPEDYLPYVEGRTGADFHIIAVGGRLNGDRVQRLVDALKQEGIDIPYVYQDLEHEFAAFVEEDEKAAGWYAARYLQRNLGRSR